MQLSPTIKLWGSDIRFWILLLFVLRLYGIWFPPLEVEHNWRQTTVTMVARNFYEIDANIFYPRVDMAGELTGITGMEFPLLNYIIFLIAKVFGYQHWYGRLVVLIVSSFGTWYFYKLIKSVFDQKMAFIASFLLLFSLWFAYSRKIMPDTFATSLAIASIYYGFDYYKTHQFKSLLFYVIFGMLGLLSKLPVVFLFLYFIFPFYQNRKNIALTSYFLIGSFILLAPSIIWYFYWSTYLTEHFGFWHFFMGKDMIEGMKETWEGIDIVLERLFHTPLRISGMLLLFISFFFFVKDKKWLPIALYFTGLISFTFMVIFKAGWTFYHHNYYILVFIPVFIVPIAYFLKDKNTKLCLFILLVVAIEGVSSQFHEFRVKDDFKKILLLEDIVNNHFAKGEMIAFNTGNYPTPLYFTHRKGMSVSNAELRMTLTHIQLKRNNIKGIVIMKKLFGKEVNLIYPIVFENEDYKIYRLQK
jgi:4-amino-4-deoxy-L-arabinose transferase-like glycosyltransferase